jgi:hypothetical protein
MQEENIKPAASEDATESDYGEVVPVYANNVRFEMSAWDLRMLFGQLLPEALRPSDGNIIDWHTDVTIPWAQAKLMHLFLGINLALYEAENGTIKVPLSVLPQPVTKTPPGDIDQTNPQAVTSIEIVQRMVSVFRDAQLGKG